MLFYYGIMSIAKAYLRVSQIVRFSIVLVTLLMMSAAVVLSLRRSLIWAKRKLDFEVG